MKCICNSENIYFYYEKPDGDNIVERYYRCNDCLYCWHERYYKGIKINE